MTLEEIAVLVEIGKLWEGGIKIRVLEESVVMEVRNTGILDRGLVSTINRVRASQPTLTFLQTNITLQVSNSLGGNSSNG